MCMNFIDELKRSASLQIRPVSRESEYLEAVLASRDLAGVEAVLAKYLGPAHKVPGQEILFDDEMRSIVDQVGGLMIDQTLFYRIDGNRIQYAMLWPWQSDPSRITLKAGIVPRATT